MELHRLHHLVAVADHGSLRLGAQALGLSPAALTRSVQGLEASLAIPLLDRSTRPARLTEAGRRVVERARHALATMELLREDLRPTSQAIEGRVRVTVGPLVAETLLGPVLTEVLRRAPGVAVTARLGHWTDGTVALKLGQVDLFLGDVTEAMADPTLSARAFPSQPIAMICRPGHPILRLRTIGAADVLRHPLVANTPPPWGVRWLQDLHRRARRPVPEPSGLLRVVCDSTALVTTVVHASDALGFAAHRLVMKEVAESRLAIVPYDTTGLRTQAGTVLVAGRPTTRATGLVLEVAHAVAEGRG